MHHIEIRGGERGRVFGREDYEVYLVCRLAGEKMIGWLRTKEDAELFAKTKANELGVDVLPTAAGD